jgi:hypothetical protein
MASLTTSQARVRLYHMIDKVVAAGAQVLYMGEYHFCTSNYIIRKYLILFILKTPTHCTTDAARTRIR